MMPICSSNLSAQSRFRGLGQRLATLLLSLALLSAASGVTLAFAPGVAAQPAQAAPVSDAFERGPAAGGITEYRLKSNGLRVLLFPDSSSPQITVNITYLVGSRHEGYGETGMAHLLEHMLFKATRKFPNLWQDMQARGFINNGTTWLDRTNYFERFAATEENLRWALEMEADRMVNAKLLPEEFATEMTVVRNEFEMGENRPQWALYARTVAAAFDWHNYGNSTIGNRSDIENVELANLRRFYERYYQPDNAVLLIAGRFDPAKTLSWIAQYFGEIPRPTRALPKLWTVEPTQDGEREVTVRRVGDANYLFAAYRTPAATHPDTPALQMLITMMTLDPSGRLYRALVKPGLAVSVDAVGFTTFDPYLMGYFVTLNRTQSLERAREVLLATVERAARTPFTEADLERARLRFEKSHEETLADSARFAVALSEAIALGDWRAFFLQNDRLKAVTLADVERVARAYFKPENRTLGRFIATDRPDRVPIATAPTLESLLATWKAADAVSAGEDFDPTPAAIESRAKRYTLPSGLKVVLWPKATRGGTTHVALRVGYGDAKTRAGMTAVEELINATLMRGARGLDRQAINDALDRLRATGDLSMDGANFQTRRAHVVGLLDLLGRVYREPTFPADEIELARKEAITAIEESAKDPDQVAANALARHFNPYPRSDVRYVPTFAERVAALRTVTRAQIVSHYQRMRGFGAAELVILGEFDEVAVRSAIERNFGWKGPTRFERVTRPAFMPKPADLRIATPDKENATFLLRTAFDLDDRAADYPALLLANFIVGGSAGSRLFVRVRDREGLSYDVWSSLSVPTFGRHATWTFGFIANPQNAARAEAVLRDELNNLLAGGLTADEFETQKRSFLDQRAVGRARDAALAAQLATLADADRTFAFVEALETNIAQLTKADFDRVMKTYLRPETLTSVLAGDFSKAK